MVKNYFLMVVVFAIFLVGCNENRIFEEHKGGFPNFRWDKTKSIEFNPQISEVNQKYMVYLAIRHIYGFQLKELELKVEMKSPSGETNSKMYELKVFNNSNEYISDCAGDYCDLTVLIEDDYEFKEKGVYTYTISHDLEVNPIPNIMEVGLIIDKKVK